MGSCRGCLHVPVPVIVIVIVIVPSRQALLLVDVCSLANAWERPTGETGPSLTVVSPVWQ
jgi:hypothetical protein